MAAGYSHPNSERGSYGQKGIGQGYWGIIGEGLGNCGARDGRAGGEVGPSTLSEAISAF